MNESKQALDFLRKELPQYFKDVEGRILFPRIIEFISNPENLNEKFYEKALEKIKKILDYEERNPGTLPTTDPVKIKLTSLVAEIFNEIWYDEKFGDARHKPIEIIELVLRVPILPTCEDLESYEPFLLSEKAKQGLQKWLRYRDSKEIVSEEFLFCSVCSRVTHDLEAKYCPWCGNEFDREEEGISITCPECSLKICGEGMLCCPSCGHDFIAKKCPKCSSELEEDDVVCPSCGHDLVKKCPDCSCEIEEDFKICPSCGHKLSSESDDSDNDERFDSDVADIQ